MLKRHTPMKRTAFKHRAPARVVLPVDDDEVVVLERVAPRLYRVPAPSAPVFRPQPKRDYVRSEALLEAVRRVPGCMLCGRFFGEGRRADPAHSNWSGHGKAGAIKADDNRIAAACRACHEWMDASGDDWLKRFTAWWGAHVLTVDYLLSNRQWPPAVPIPDTSEFPSALTMDSG